jgi:pyruvate formate lyase activating enzyme
VSKEATLYKRLNNNKLLCQACAHYCIIGENETGICGVRSVKGSKLWLDVYSKIAAINIDPIEKKPIYHLLPGSKSLSIGTVGCNFGCLFCQNSSISQYPKEKGGIRGETITPEQIIMSAIHYKCESISYTYNEPAIFLEFAYDVAKLAKERGLKNIFVTSGYESKEALEMIGPYLDAMNIDLKSFSKDFYKNICKAKLNPVLETIKRAYEKGILIEITTLLIEGLNDSEKELREIAEFIKSISPNIPWHISAFHPTYKMLEYPVTSFEALKKAYDIAKEIGLNYVYIGNYNNPKYSSTYCANCNEVVIKRDGYLGDRIVNLLVDKKCPKCGFKIEIA